MKRKYDDDDGRIIADMSFLNLDNSTSSINLKKNKSVDFTNIDNNLQSNSLYLTKKEQFYFMLGALKASLLIGLAYLIGLGSIVALICIFG